MSKPSTKYYKRSELIKNSFKENLQIVVFVFFMFLNKPICAARVSNDVIGGQQYAGQMRHLIALPLAAS